MENQLVPAQNMIQKLLATKEKALKNYLGDKDNALRFMTAVMHCIEKTPKLLECTPQSVIGAFMECAALGLYPGNASGDCYVLPYAGKAQFQLGYKGMKTLAYRSGVLACDTDIVFSKDKFKIVRGTNPRIEHEEANGDRGKPIGAYAWAEVTPGNKIFFYMKEAEIMKIKALSQAKDSKYSPWNSNNDPMMWMWRKTPFKQLAKMMPTSEKLSRAIYADNVSERGGYFLDEGKIIDVGFEDSETKIEIGKDKKQALRDRKEKNGSKSTADAMPNNEDFEPHIDLGDKPKNSVDRNNDVKSSNTDFEPPSKVEGKTKNDNSGNTQSSRPSQDGLEPKKQLQKSSLKELFGSK